LTPPSYTRRATARGRRGRVSLQSRDQTRRARVNAANQLQRSLPPQLWFALFGQYEPGQHGWLSPPHTWQLPLPSQANGLAHQPLPPAASQQGCPEPPQAWHMPLFSTVNGAVQPTMLPQRFCPAWPQSPQPNVLLHIRPLPH
jgi:hypothetical protein